MIMYVQFHLTRAGRAIDQVQWWFLGLKGRGVGSHCSMGTERVSLWNHDKVLEMDNGDDFTILRMFDVT